MRHLKGILFGAGMATILFSACGTKENAQLTVSGLNPTAFDSTINGKKTELITLTNHNGMEVCLTNYGGRVVSISVPDRNSKPTDVVLGYDNIAQYADTVNSPSDYGSTVGRYANRIKDAKLTVDGKEYKLKATATYTVKSNNTLDIVFEATTDKETVVNMTNHCYFNLNGDLSKEGFNQVMYINADKFTPSDKFYIPTGEIKNVAGTPMDFRKPSVISEKYDTTFDQIKNATGYDHNWCLNTYKDNKGDDKTVAASLYSPKTGIKLEVFTNEPGLQVYPGNFQGTGIACKHGVKYPKHVSVCFESQKYPDSPTKIKAKTKGWEISNPYLKPGEKYYSHLAYKFSTSETLEK